MKSAKEIKTEKIQKLNDTGESGKIWNEIKNLPIEMFSLAGQKVEDYAELQFVEPSKCYLKIKVGSVLPALETSVGKKYTVTLTEAYVIVGRA